MLNLHKANRESFAPTELLRHWVPTGDARCPLVAAWTKSQGKFQAGCQAKSQAKATPAAAQTKGTLAAVAQSADSILEYAQCA